MGANSCGVVVGNEAVWTVEDSDGPAALLGMDLVRCAAALGLARKGWLGGGDAAAGIRLAGGRSLVPLLCLPLCPFPLMQAGPGAQRQCSAGSGYRHFAA